MQPSKQKEVKDLYPMKDIAPTVAGILVVLVVAVTFARFITSYASL